MDHALEIHLEGIDVLNP